MISLCGYSRMKLNDRAYRLHRCAVPTTKSGESVEPIFEMTKEN